MLMLKYWSTSKMIKANNNYKCIGLGLQKKASHG